MASPKSGSPHPLGVTPVDGGVNVAVFSRHATRIIFCLFAEEGEKQFALSSRHGDVHYGFIANIKAGQLYGFRAEGPFDAAQGHLFDVSKLLIDPYAQQLDRHFLWHPELAMRGAETSPFVPKCVVTSPLPNMETLPPRTPRIIYEVAVKAFTKLHPLVPENLRGTVAALAHPACIEHFLKLGVDTIELMPLMAWADERHLSVQGLSNAWGYNPISFFAPDPRLAPGGLIEIRGTVAALHRAGLRVILDVVYNHSGESDLGGPTICFRGLDNATYYAHANGALVNDSGTGNTLAANNPPVTELILASMRHWVSTAGIDGFRYDLATVMGREPEGFNANAPLLNAIQEDAVLAPLIHIAEPWDIGPGGYQLGHFPKGWGEWNDRYRDDVRHFWRGDRGAIGNFATRLTGSSDIFDLGGRRPSSSVNFVSAHDGFTLRDFVSYSHKNNYANGEGNRDGNSSEPCWISDDPKRDAEALLATLFMSRGTLMLTAGDEFGRSQQGNNNAYAQDNETTWLDWNTADRSLIGHVAGLAKFRMDNADFFADEFLTGSIRESGGFQDIEWLATNGDALDWNSAAIDAFGMLLSSNRRKERLLIWFNRSAKSVSILLPSAQVGLSWNNDISQCAPRSVTPLLEVTWARKNSLKPDDQTIHELAAAAGIQNEWWEVNGTGHVVSVETKRALLAAMALPLATRSEAREALEKLAISTGLPPFALASPDKAFSVMIEKSGGAQSYLIKSEDGQTWSVVSEANRAELTLPALPAGHYELLPESRPEKISRVAVTNGKCFQPTLMQHDKRVHGLTSHLYALRHEGDSGIGDFETLARFCEASARMGGSLAGINPLHHMFTDDRVRVSPYQPSDRRFIDPIYIDVNELVGRFGSEKAGIKYEHEARRLRETSHVDYGAVWKLKDDLLRRLFNKSQASKEFEAFIARRGQALQDHARFEARNDATRYRFAMWLQWVADTQLAAVAKRADAAGLELGIYRDLALGCAYEGGEVWARPELYATSVSIGAPPDPFSRDGQVWNLPPFNPLVLERRGYRPFIEIMRANMAHAKILRIDHVLGFARQFWVPRGASGADGAYVTMAQENFLGITALESELANCTVIGEDLGTVPDGLRQNLTKANVLSYRVLWFEQDENRFQPPENYPKQAAACLSSHDLAPFRGWEETASTNDIQKLERALVSTGCNADDLLSGAHEFVAKTPCSIMLIQADDLSGETEPLNVPGTDTERPNWRRRLSVGVDGLGELQTTKKVMAAIHRTGRGRNA